MKITLTRRNKRHHYVATTEEGHNVLLDASDEIGGEGLGVRPMQLVLMAIGGCSAIDVGMILEKQKQKPNDIKIEVEAERTGKVPSLFEEIIISFKLKGEIQGKQAIRAVQLSLEKYCSVAALLKPTAVLYYSIVLNGDRIITKEVVPYG